MGPPHAARRPLMALYNRNMAEKTGYGAYLAKRYLAKTVRFVK